MHKLDKVAFCWLFVSQHVDVMYIKMKAEVHVLSSRDICNVRYRLLNVSLYDWHRNTTMSVHTTSIERKI